MTTFKIYHQYRTIPLGSGSGNKKAGQLDQSRRNMERLAQDFLASLEHKSQEELLARRNGLFFLINGDVF